MRRIISNELFIRRFDTLAKLMCPSSHVSDCVAVTITSHGVYISSNQPKGVEEEECASILKQRYEAIQGCFNRCIDEHSAETRTTIINGTIGTLKGLKGLSKMYNRSDIKEPLPKSLKTNRSAATRGLEKLVSDIYTMMLKGEQRENGLNKDECVALLKPENMRILIPSMFYDEEVAMYTHAEQLLLDQFRRRDCPPVTSAGRKVLALGISKLSCETCRDAMTGLSEAPVVYRGDSGVRFNHVHNHRTGAISPSGSIPLGDEMPSLTAENSDSEPEESDELNQVLKTIKKTPTKLKAVDRENQVPNQDPGNGSRPVGLFTKAPPLAGTKKPLAERLPTAAGAFREPPTEKDKGSTEGRRSLGLLPQ